MLCRKPFTKDGAAYPCGQCMPCRVRRKREWQHRIMLEAMLHKRNCFVTLTYSDPSLVFNTNCDYPVLVRKHITDFLKRLRWRLEPERMRYFGVGEYADDVETPDFKPGRPHYHMVAFGFGCRHYITRGLGIGGCCDICDMVYRAWGHGHVFLGQVTAQSAGYVAGYCTKKMTDPEDRRLRGRPAEFSFMSTDPGVGVPAMKMTAAAILDIGLDATMDDVPNGARHGGSILPYGRTLKRKLRSFIGRCEDAPPSTIKALKEGLLPLRQIAFDTSTPFAQVLSKIDDGRVLNMEARMKLFRKRSKL